jgi:kynureninase
MGHAAPFDFDDGYAPAPGIDRFLCGTPPILGLAALEQGLALFDEAEMAVVAAKSAALCSQLIDQVESRCADAGFTMVTPRDAAERGSHVSFAHPNAWPICRALIARGVIGDFRAPDILRFGVTPLYTSFADVWRAVDILCELTATRAWDRPEYRAATRVT